MNEDTLELELFPLKAEDFLTAILFFNISHELVIQVPKRHHVGLVRKCLRLALGEPDRVTTSAMYFDRRRIEIMTVDEDTAGYEFNNIFYICFKNGSDLLKHERGDVEDEEARCNLDVGNGIDPYSGMRGSGAGEG